MNEQVDRKEKNVPQPQEHWVTEYEIKQLIPVTGDWRIIANYDCTDEKGQVECIFEVLPVAAWALVDVVSVQISNGKERRREKVESSRMMAMIQDPGGGMSPAADAFSNACDSVRELPPGISARDFIKKRMLDFPYGERTKKAVLIEGGHENPLFSDS